MSTIGIARIVVTGGAGFIGSNLCEDLLERGNQVICLDDFSTGKEANVAYLKAHKNFVLIKGDIRDMDCCLRATKGVDYVLHQAALGSVPRSVEDPVTSNDINISGFLNMLVASLDAKVKRFVYASSSAVYGDAAELPKQEDKIGKPLSPYAITKAVNEAYARVFSELYGLETVGLRYFNVFGKRQDPNGPYAAVIPRFIQSLIEKRAPTIYGDGTQSRDFTYVKDVVQANFLAMSCKLTEKSEVFNIACGKQTTLNRLYSIIVRLVQNYHPDVSKISPIYGPERKGDIKHSLASIEKARSLMGFVPEYDVEKGLRESIDWYWEHLGAGVKKAA